MTKIQELNQGRLESWLETEIRIRKDGKILTITRRELLGLYNKYVIKTVRNYADKKINGCYKQLKNPKIEYFVSNNPDEQIFPISKLAAEYCLDNLGHKLLTYGCD